MSLDDTARIIEQSPTWDGRPVRLMSCETGAGDFAQDLADRLAVPVYAPDGALVPYWDGTKEVLVHDDGTPGMWRRFEPRP